MATKEVIMSNTLKLGQQGIVRAAGLLLVLLAAGCNDSSAPTTDVAAVTGRVAATGSLALRVIVNVDFDPNGYSLAVDRAAPKFVPAVFPGREREVTVFGLSAGSHTVSVTGLAEHCMASPHGPIAFEVSAGATTQVDVAVVCKTHA
jgi:hypothetical protein